MCETALHENFRRLMVGIEIYVDRIASMRSKALNASLELTRKQMLDTGCDENALDLRTIESAMIREAMDDTSRKENGA